MQNNQYDAPNPYGYITPDQLGAPLSPLDVFDVHEQRRRRRLLRVISLGVLVPVVILIPTALIPTLDKVTLVALIIALIGTLAAFLLNQAEQVSAGSFALLAGLTGAVAWEIVAKAQAQHGIDLSDLRLYDLFILPIVVSAVLLGRRGPIIFGSAAAIFTVVSLFALPHTPELQLYWNGHYKDAILGSVYDVIAVPIAIQLLAATGAWLGADSVRSALLEASRADDLAAANAQIQAQAHSLELQRYRLQQGIGQLQAIHAAVSRGQWDARATITDGELLPVALSLNLLLDRISRMTRESDQRARVDTASHELAIALRRLRAGEPYTPPNYTGTPFDEVLVELARLRSIPAPNSRTTGVRLGGPSVPPRSLPAPASQPERPFPFGPATPAAPSTPSRPANPRFDPASYRNTPDPIAPRFDPAAFANPPSTAPGTGPIPSTVDPLLQPGRMSLPPIFNQPQQPNAPDVGGTVFNNPAALNNQAFNTPAYNRPNVPPPSVPLASSGQIAPSGQIPPSGPLVPPIDARAPLPTVPRSAFRPSNPEADADAWPDLAVTAAPERGPVSTALPAWLQAQATAASGSPANGSPANGASPNGAPVNPVPDPASLSASDLIQPDDLPPWLRETAGTTAPADPAPAAEDDDATSSYLPPWLQNIQ